MQAPGPTPQVLPGAPVTHLARPAGPSSICKNLEIIARSGPCGSCSESWARTAEPISHSFIGRSQESFSSGFGTEGSGFPRAPAKGSSGFSLAATHLSLLVSLSTVKQFTPRALGDWPGWAGSQFKVGRRKRVLRSQQSPIPSSTTRIFTVQFPDERALCHHSHRTQTGNAFS
jgi:hypothetical protein